MPRHFMDGGGQMGAAIRAFDWTRTPLGPPENWPSTLKSTVALVLDSLFPMCLVWGTGMISIYNDAFRPILGDKPEALGRPFSDVWSEVWDTIGPIANVAFQGKATFLEDLPLVVNRRGHPEEAWFTFCYSPVRDDLGHVVGMLDTVVETTGKIRSEQQTQLLNEELAHRIKNMLAVVQSVAYLTLSSSTDLDSAMRLLDQRIQAINASHEILTQANWSGAWVKDVVLSAIAPHIISADVVTVQGPPVFLGKRRVLSLALAMHELATNAVKHGALSVKEGRIRIGWEAGSPDSGDMFRLHWKEEGGPAVTAPDSHGFGSKLITRVLPRDFGGLVTVDYAPDGLRFELCSTMNRLVEPEE